jgi:PKD repeat protein
MNKPLFFLVLTFPFLIFNLSAQNWTTHNGNNERNGLSKMTGPQNISTPLWTVNDATPTGLGMNIYSFGDRFVTSRVDFSPYYAMVECRDLQSGELLWTSPDLGAASILFTMGFNEDAVYAHDYNSNLFYALDAKDGSVKWVTEFGSYTFGPMDGVIYTCERNLIINGDLGSVDESTICLDKETGEILWTNANWISITPNETKAAHGNHLYMITGAINQPKLLTAVDIRNGDNLYYSEALPGDADQEGPIAISPDGTIYFQRDGGDFFAVADNGTGFDILWTCTPINMGLFVMNFGIDQQGDILMMDNGKIYRISKTHGTPVDSSLVSGISAGRISIGADSTVYVDDTEGGYYAFSHNLQTLKWQLNIPGNYYAGPALSKDGIMVVCGAGNTINAYQNTDPHSPVADFTASDHKINRGESIDFTDQSSFSPTSWTWNFQGGEPSSSSDQDPQGIFYNEPGIYEVTLIASSGLGTDTITKLCYIEVVMFEEVASNEPVEDVTIFPNPATEYFSITTRTDMKISVYNTLGVLVYMDETRTGARRIDVSGWPSGIYVVRLEGSGVVMQGKVIVKC